MVNELNLWMKNKDGKIIFHKSVYEIDGKLLFCRVGGIFGEGVKEGKVAELCRKVVNGELGREEPNEVVNLMYAGDMVEELRRVVSEGGKHNEEECVVPRFYTRVWGEVVNLVCSFKDREDAGEEIELRDDFERKLYATFLSHYKS